MIKEEAKEYIREWCPYDRQEEIIKALEQEPCEDVIDRAEAMTEIMMFAGNVKSDEEDVYIKVSDAVQLLRELPPVTPQTKMGCKGCKFEKTGNNSIYPCSHCSRCYTDKYKAESEE